MSGFADTDRGISLSGAWKALAAEEATRRRIGDIKLDDDSWIDVEVPGLWRSTELLSEAESVLYRRHFELHGLAQGNRRWLVIDGLCYQGDIWFDGAYLGDTEGYFVEHSFEITEAASQAREHLLAIEANCSTPADRTAKQSITGVLQHSDTLDQDLNPGGLWRDVRIEETGPVKIGNLRVLVLEADNDRAIIRLGAELDSSVTTTAEVVTSISYLERTEHTQELVLARGRNEIEWHVAVEKPELWWPFALGEQPLYDTQVTVKIGDCESDTRTRRIGLRSFELRNWIASVNGERIYLKGSNFGPCSSDLSAVSEDDHRRDLALAKNAGLNLVRVHGHVAHPYLYQQADQLGMLIFQDFPLQWGYSRAIRSQATRQATALVHQFGHHPSIVLWNAHNEPFRYNHKLGERRDANSGSTFGALTSINHQVPSWNRSILDRAIKRSLEKADPTRPAIAHSGVTPHFPQLDGTDSHLWFGWEHGEISDLKVVASRIPRLLRFVSEFGAQALPKDDEISEACGADNFPLLNREVLTERFGAQLELLEQHTPVSEADSWEDWVHRTQLRQAEVVRHTIEILRTLKYRPNGGFCQFLFADALPFVSGAVLDHHRRPKMAWDALTAANRPVIVVADLHREAIPAAGHKCAIHVVSDLRNHIGPATLTIEWRAPGMETQRWTFTGEFEPDTVTKVAEPVLVSHAHGSASLSLELRGPQVHAVNLYQVNVY
ncbi:MAG: glycoside hydrolase family 2 TIM barrel-domain containing protein [Actinomycetota bacterium]|nr:glycoside hydrolase family 2 TIM barrel-domain containing protein [Actinomycetota bacterium]